MKGQMMDDFPLTLTPLLSRAELLFPRVAIASRKPDRTIHHTDYGTVVRRARSLAAALGAEGVNPGDRVATLMWNHAAHLEAYLGVPAAGAVLHTLNLRLPPEHLAHVIDHAHDRWLMVDDVLLPVLERIRDRIRVDRILVVPGSGAPVADGAEDYERLLARYPAGTSLPRIDERDAAGLCYTSGTTGWPRGFCTPIGPWCSIRWRWHTASDCARETRS